MKYLPDVAFFTILAQHVSLASAAKELDVTAPAVSRRLAQIENRLKVKLLNRTTRRLSLTPEGELYLERGGAILAELSALEYDLAHRHNLPSGRLVINATHGFGLHFLPSVVAEFVTAYPEVNVVLQISDQPMQILEHGVDIGIRFGTPPNRHFYARKLACNPRILCASPAYLKKNFQPKVPRDLQNLNCIVTRENSDSFSNWQLTDGTNQETIKVSGSLSSNQGEVALDWTLAGHGILLRSEWSVGKYIANGTLVRVLPSWVGPNADIHAVYSQQRTSQAKISAFIDLLSARL
jgi:LysR family transcriptional activator of dmlA